MTENVARSDRPFAANAQEKQLEKYLAEGLTAIRSLFIY